MISEKLKSVLEENGYFKIKELPDGRIVALQKFIFTTGLCVGLDEYSLQGRYCYEELCEAICALNEWDGTGDPSGQWIKYKGMEGERSNEKITKREV